MAPFDWHRDRITRSTPIIANYRNTQNVRRFFTAECGSHFKFDRSFMAWLKDGAARTMGDAADEWLRRAVAISPRRPLAQTAASAQTAVKAAGTNSMRRFER